MAERYDEVERQMGICSFASADNDGFAAVLKARYSDFIVHEVDVNGEIARLESLENNLKEEERKAADVDKSVNNESGGSNEESRKRSSLKTLDGEASKKAKLSQDITEDTITLQEAEDVHSSLEEFLKQIHDKLSALVSDEVSTKITELISYWEKEKKKVNISTLEDRMRQNQFPPPKGVDDDKKYVTLPLVENKEDRKAIHMLIKSDLVKQFAAADTVDKKVRIWHIMFETQMPNYGKFVRDDRFKNKANQKKSKKPDWPSDRPNFLKFVLYKENIDTGTAAKDIGRIIRLPPKGHRNNKGGSGHIGYAGMKDKRGVTSQFCTVYRKTAGELMALNHERERGGNKHGGGNSSLKGKPIIRVGQFSYVNQDLRLGQLKGNRFDIVLRNVCVGGSFASKEERISRATAILRDAAVSLKDAGFINYFGMQRFGKFHDTHKVGLEILKGDFERACEIIMCVKENGENERTKATREKWAKRFTGVNLEDDRSAKDAELKCAKTVLRELGRFMNCETSIVSSLSRNPRDYKKAFGSIAKHMRSMFLHAYQSYIWNKAASHRIAEGGCTSVRLGDLVLVEDKGLEEGGSGTSGLKGKQVQEVTIDDLETCKYSISDVVLPLVGSKIMFPTDSTGDYIESLLEEDGLSRESFNSIDDRELAVGGDYRKVLCKPSDVEYHIKFYNDPLQPLVQTDLMAVQNMALDCVDVSNSSINDGIKYEENVIIGMVIGFTLPPSAYATIALRELMKRPTSSTYQAELSLEGDCEAKIEHSVIKLKTSKAPYTSKVIAPGATLN